MAAAAILAVEGLSARTRRRRTAWVYGLGAVTCVGVFAVSTVGEDFLEGFTARSYWGPAPDFEIEKAANSKAVVAESGTSGRPARVVFDYGEAREHGGARSLGSVLSTDRASERLELLTDRVRVDPMRRWHVAGDVDGDAVDDFVTAMSFYAKPKDERGSVWVFSGATGRGTRFLEGANQAFGYARALAATGDVDRDGRADLLVGGFEDSDGSGVVRLYSGANAEVLKSYTGGRPGDRFGWAVVSIGDLVGDGWPELVVGAPFGDDRPDELLALDGESGRLIWRHVDAEDSSLASEMELHGDLNGDGVRDLRAGQSILSGRDGVVLRRQASGENFQGLLGDWDGDGSTEILQSRSVQEQRFYQQDLYSRTEVRSLDGDRVLLSLGFTHPFQSAKAVPDLDGDGMRDVILEFGQSLSVYGSSRVR